MKYPPAIDVDIFEDDGGWWRYRTRRNLVGRSKDEIHYWLAQIGEDSIPSPIISSGRYDTDLEAKIAALEEYIETFSDMYYDPPLTIEIIDPDDTPGKLTVYRKEAAWHDSKQSRRSSTKQQD